MHTLMRLKYAFQMHFIMRLKGSTFVCPTHHTKAGGLRGGAGDTGRCSSAQLCESYEEPGYMKS